MPIGVINRRLHYYLMPDNPVYFNFDAEINNPAASYLASLCKAGYYTASSKACTFEQKTYAASCAEIEPKEIKLFG